MKFYCEQSELLKALNIVSKGVSSRTTLPILKGIKIESDREKGKAIFTASDLEIYIETSIDAVCEESGEIVVSAKLFSDIIRKLKGGDVLFSIKEENVVSIQNGNFNSTLQGIPSEDFPKIVMNETENSIVMDKELLKDLIRGTSFAASIEEARGIITGILTEIEDHKVNMVALDGFRMAIRRELTENKTDQKQEMIISGRIINEIGKILSENEEEESIYINIDDKRANISMGKTKISTRLMEGDFIKYEDVLPKENEIKIEIDRKELLECVERASIIVKEGKNSFIRFKIEEDELILSSRADEGTTKESLSIVKEGGDLEIGFNGRFITDTLKAIDDEKILMLLNTNINPCLIKPLKGESYEYIVLPVRLGV